MSISILVMNAWDHVTWVYSKGFILRGLIVGLLFSLPLAVLLEIVNLIGRRKINIWQTTAFMIVFYGLEIFVERYGISSDTGFLSFIDNIWVQTLCGYVAGASGAGVVLTMILWISQKIHKQQRT